MKEAAHKLNETEQQQAQLVTSLMELKTEVERQVQLLPPVVQELGALNQSKDSAGPMVEWAHGVNAAITELKNRPGGQDSAGTRTQQGYQMRGILESKVWAGLKVLEQDKGNSKEWSITLRDSYDQARPGRKTTTMRGSRGKVQRARNRKGR